MGSEARYSFSNFRSSRETREHTRADGLTLGVSKSLTAWNAGLESAGLSNTGPLGCDSGFDALEEVGSD